MKKKKCPDCNGTGFIRGSPDDCLHCKGKGEVDSK